MQSPNAACVGRADRAAEQDVEGSEVGGGVRVRREQVVWRQAGCVQRAMVTCEAAKRLGVLSSVSNISSANASSRSTSLAVGERGRCSLTMTLHSPDCAQTHDGFASKADAYAQEESVQSEARSNSARRSHHTRSRRPTRASHDVEVSVNCWRCVSGPNSRSLIYHFIPCTVSMHLLQRCS